MSLSFRKVRNLGLTLLVGVVVLIGANSLVTSSRTITSLTEALRETRPILSKIARLRTDVEAAQFYFLERIAGCDTDILALVAHVDTATEKARELESRVAEPDKAEVRRFIASLSRFRKASIKACAMPRGETAVNGSTITDYILTESNRLLSGIKRLSEKMRGRVDLSMALLVEENLRAQRANVIFISSGLIFSLLVALFMNRALVKPARLLLTGLKNMGGSDLAQGIDPRSGDVFITLANAINEMVSTRCDAEQALKESELNYRELVENANSILLKLDIEGNVTFFNEFAQKFFGYSKEEILGRNVIGTIVPEAESSGRDLRGFFAKFRSDPDRYQNNENENITKQGNRIWISWTNRAIYDADGRVVGILCVGNDITQRKRLEEQLIQSQKMEAIGCLAGGVAHDFNNLLTAIAGYSDLLLCTLDEKDPLRRDIEEIKKAAGRATSLTRQLMAFSRRQTIQPRVLDMNAVITGMERMLQRVIGDDIKVTTILDPDLVRVNVDRAKIEQVIMNLISNARDATPPRGRITIETRSVSLGKDYSMAIPESRPGQFACVSITDTGSGMKKEILDRIFDPFFSTKGPDKGAGLGLSIVYGIIRQHGGWVKAYSEPGKGSVFRIYLPVFSLDVANEARNADGAEFRELRGSGERILVVEDEEGIRKFIEKSLEKNNYRVRAASSGGEAREIFRREGMRFELLYSDISLPDGEGIDLAGEFLSLNGGLRVLLTSGFNDRLERLPLIRDKGFHFLQKPTTLIAMLRAVKNAIGNPPPKSA